MRKFYAGVGSRETPDYMLDAMSEASLFLHQCGYAVRTGGALGADSAFIQQDPNAEVFLPWDTYNGFSVARGAHVVSQEAMAISAKFHPAWQNCSMGAKKLHGRNAQIILGKDLNDPVEFVLCWTPDGKDSGGTGQAIRIATAYGIPVFNFQNKDHWPALDIKMKEIADAAGYS